MTGRDVLLEGDFLIHPFHPNYDLTPDGTQLLVLAPLEGSAKVVVVNWGRELREKVQAR